MQCWGGESNIRYSNTGRINHSVFINDIIQEREEHGLVCTKLFCGVVTYGLGAVAV